MKEHALDRQRGTKPIGRCQQPTKRRFNYATGNYENIPGRCDNKGKYRLGDIVVCGKHYNAAIRGVA